MVQKFVHLMSISGKSVDKYNKAQQVNNTGKSWDRYNKAQQVNNTGKHVDKYK
jgi:hypothetical protein